MPKLLDIFVLLHWLIFWFLAALQCIICFLQMARAFISTFVLVGLYSFCRQKKDNHFIVLDVHGTYFWPSHISKRRFVDMLSNNVVQRGRYSMCFLLVEFLYPCIYQLDVKMPKSFQRPRFWVVLVVLITQKEEKLLLLMDNLIW